MTETTQRFADETITRVEIESRDGDVSVAWTDREDVLVRGEEIEVAEETETLRIAPRPREGLLGLLGRDGMEAELPPSVRHLQVNLRQGELKITNVSGTVNAKVDHGDTSITGGAGAVALKLGAGDLRLAEFEGPVTISSGSGDLRVEEVQGDLSIQSGAGSIRIRGGAGPVVVKAGAGDISIEARTSERTTIKNGAGDVNLRGGETGETAVHAGMGDVTCRTRLGIARHEFMTGSGDIKVGIPTDLTARIEVMTARGSVESEMPLVSVGKRGPRSLLGRRVVGSVGEGSERAEILARAINGDVALEWLPVPAARVPSPPRVTTAPPTPPSPPEPPAPPASPGAPAEAAIPMGPPEETDDREAIERAILTELAAGTLSVAEAERLLDALVYQTE